MLPPVGLQLYSVRDYAQESFEDAVRRVAAMGYVGVEPAGFPGTTPEAAGALFRELGLEVCSAHTALPLGDQQAEVLSAMEAIGCTRIISGLGPDAFKSPDQTKRTCDLFNEAAGVARANGMTLGYHNHWWEYTPVEGKYPYQLMLELLDPDVFFEVDTYWVQTAGVDVATVIRELGERAPLLHIKDGPCVQTEPMTAVGDGVMDFPTILDAAGGVPEWLIVELDRCATDMMAAVERSVTYLVEKGLGRGR
jgi:sugar phosphate isomerase/epimerase